MAASQTSLIRDMLVVVDLAGQRSSAKLATGLAARLGAHLTGLALAYDPITPAYSMAAPIPTDFMVSAREQAMAEAKEAQRELPSDLVQAVSALANYFAITCR